MDHAPFLPRPISTALALLLAGCASSPFIDSPRPPRAAEAPVVVSKDFGYALKYADATYDAYRAKLKADVDRQQALASGLLSLAYVTMGAAIGHAHRDIILTAAGSGALAWQLGTWNKSDDRLLIYVEGMKAMACAKAAVGSLRLSSESLSQISAARQALWQQMEATSASLAGATQWLNVAGASQTPNSETAQTARDELSATATVFDKANQLLEASASIPRKVDGASALLEGQIDKVRVDIDKALNGTKADLASLPQHIAALGQYADLLAPGLGLSTVFSDRIAAAKKDIGSTAQTATDGKKGDSAKPPPKAAYVPLEPRDELAKALGSLRAGRALLAARVADLAGSISSTDVDTKAELSGCGVDVAKLGIGFKIDRSDLSFKAGQAGAAFVTLSGGTRPYTASPLEAPLAGLTLVLPPDSPTLTVVADTKTVAGSVYHVKLGDATGASRMLTLKVDAAATTTTATESGTPQCQGFEAATKAQLCLLQDWVRATVTGTLDAQTCDGFVRYIAPNGIFDAVSRAELFKQKQLPVDADDARVRAALSLQSLQKCGLPARARRTPVRDTGDTKLHVAAPAGKCSDTTRVFPTEAEYLELSAALKLNPPVKQIDDSFRRAVAEYARSSGLQPDSNGDLSRCVYQALKGKP